MSTPDKTRIGLRYGTVIVVPHDPDWAAHAEHHQETIRAALGSLATDVEHVGSTAVAGMPAKPIIDLAVALRAQAEPSAAIDALTAAGYLFRGDKGNAGGLLFAAEPEPGLRTVHIHVVAFADPQWERYLAVRDRLRNRPQTAAAYSELKARLAGQHPDDRTGYTNAKSAFLRHLLADLPAHPEIHPVQRVRAVLITPAGRLLAVRRTKPGQEPYWMLPGGGIEPTDASLEDAVLREIREEVGGHAILHRLIHIASAAGHTHAIFLGHIDHWDPAARTGPELADPANGRHDLDELALDPDLLNAGWLWPVPTAQFLADALRDDIDLFTLPDLRQDGEIRWRSRRVPQPYDGPVAMVTGSDTKFAIARAHLALHGVAVEHLRQDLVEIQSVDVAAVAFHKAEQAYAQFGRPVIVEDSSFGLDELAGYPGALVKHLIDAVGAKAVAHLADLTTTRACTSTAALVYADRDGLVTFTHSQSGTVALVPAGHADRSPLWMVYVPPGATKPLAAMPKRDQTAWHRQWERSSVFAQFGRWYARHMPTAATVPPE